MRARQGSAASPPIIQRTEHSLTVESTKLVDVDRLLRAAAEAQVPPDAEFQFGPWYADTTKRTRIFWDETKVQP